MVISSILRMDLAITVMWLGWGDKERANSAYTNVLVPEGLFLNQYQ